MDTRGFHREGQPEDLLLQMINVLVLASDFPLMARSRAASAGAECRRLWIVGTSPAQRSSSVAA
jgi:hypothetical protein